MSRRPCSACRSPGAFYAKSWPSNSHHGIERGRSSSCQSLTVQSCHQPRICRQRAGSCTSHLPRNRFRRGPRSRQCASRPTPCRSFGRTLIRWGRQSTLAAHRRQCQSREVPHQRHHLDTHQWMNSNTQPGSPSFRRTSCHG